MEEAKKQLDNERVDHIRNKLKRLIERYGERLGTKEIIIVARDTREDKINNSYKIVKIDGFEAITSDGERIPLEYINDESINVGQRRGSGGKNTLPHIPGMSIRDNY